MGGGLAFSDGGTNHRLLWSCSIGREPLRARVVEERVLKCFEPKRTRITESVSVKYTKILFHSSSLPVLQMCCNQVIFVIGYTLKVKGVHFSKTMGSDPYPFRWRSYELKLIKGKGHMSSQY